MQTSIDSCNQERAAFPEYKTLHVKNNANVANNSDITTLHFLKNGRQEYRQEDLQIPFD